ncbi:nucleotidyl transferase AbiEii/AbiGii toxin family protein [Sphingobacterium multivorum]|uniref:Nucleotidyl transferase AbiEii/AbiGii toxin family protein n=1 Tax=Sphingobacterium multivorum TaxID=28454 RepID=A0ABX7CVQ3_SPHMU|nr:nucleotidyl transferase AbiEii/AbiGii toxin family protein [Sphingobacterium multivorum]QQT56178.1 nucleotidyl transferase AbiEii/AbiGii toxin family protein [Sphingobacterium multivorum]
MLYYNTVNDLLRDTLLTLMKADVFSTFRLVGGTALSLHLGHRESVDIDLFSDVPYGSLDFASIDNYLKDTFSYVDHLSNITPAMGKSYTIGNDKNNSVKLDVFYADPFIQELIEEDNIRLASIEEIIAMKIDVIQRGGRKKDFWDLHELLDKYSISQMVALHEERYPFSHDEKTILINLINFENADNDFDPVCLKGKYWEFIKADFEEVIGKI